MREGTELWKEVEILQGWNSRAKRRGGRDRSANQTVPWVLDSASNVSLLRKVGVAKIMSVVGVERPHLRALKPPDKTACMALLTLLLTNCPQLEY